MEKALKRIIDNRIEQVEKDQRTDGNVPFNFTFEDRIVITRTINDFLDTVIVKYAIGKVKHGGSLLTRPLLTEATNEVVDLMVYLTAQKLKQQ